MFKKALLVAAVFAVVSTGAVRAQDPVPTVNTNGRTYTKEMGFVRIVTLKDRIKNQRLRIALDLNANILTADQAAGCDAILDSMAAQMKAEREANGPKLIMTRDNYDAYNTTLDGNSALIHEEKQYFYYYGPYVDQGPDYSYSDAPYPNSGAPTPSVSAEERATPRIFELKDRIKSQRARIAQGLTDNTLTADQAAACGIILDAVANQMKADYQANGAAEMTKDQYTAFNTSLDANSTVIHEAKRYFYYYNGPHYGQYYGN